MKSCLIYGHNGLDLDIAFNLRSFYRQLGFKVFFSDKLLDADLLVIVRAIDSPIDISSFGFLQVHVFDYGGWNFDAFVRTINHKITYIFCTSEMKRKRLIDFLYFPQSQVFIALPPVDVKLWSKSIQKVKNNFVHIGNYKPNIDGDLIKVRFNEILSRFNIHIWGLGWQLDNRLYHGKVSLFDVSTIYSSSKYALGLMYPFQREVTFSGRFWHAPLNGCSLLSEPGLYTSFIPGVIETDYSIEDIEKKTAIKFDRIILQKQAREFWIKQNNETKSIIIIILSPLIYNQFNFTKLINLIYFFFENKLKEYFQKLRLFKLIKNKY
jgi:hypothetical protein